MQEPGKQQSGHDDRLGRPVMSLSDPHATRPERHVRMMRWKKLARALSTILVVQHVVPSSATVATAAAEERVVTDAGADGGSTPLYPAYPNFVSLPDLPSVTDSPAVRNGGGRGQARPVVQGIPATVLQAYQRAVDNTRASEPGCHLQLPLLAAIGKVESGHARGGDVDAQGTTRTPILGPRLDGSPGVAAITDTDHGVYDDDTVWDRAVGSMQFIPSTWRSWAADGNADRRADPNNVFDASLAAGRYLCAAGHDVATPEGLRRAVLAYNHSESYLNLVLAWMRVYSGGPVAVPDTPGSDSDTAPGAPRHPARQPEHTPPPHRADNTPEPGRPAGNQPAPVPSPGTSTPGGEGGGAPGGALPSSPNAPTLPAPVPTSSAPPSTVPAIKTGTTG
ncbi:lytic murein transglycosylase [Streptomyces xantholiticus]